LYGKLRYFLFGKGRLIEPAQLRRVYRESLAMLVEKNGSADSVGDYLEFGVSQGTSMEIMYKELKRIGNESTSLYGFDSFEGMPESTDGEDDGTWSRGDFKQDIDVVKSRLSSAGIDWNRVHLEKGWFDDTCTSEFINKFGIKKAGIIMIDCDIYSSTVVALDFCEPLIKDHAVIVFDDWHSGDLAEKNLGERKAFEDFLSKNPGISATELGGYECFGYSNGVYFLVTRNASTS